MGVLGKNLNMNIVASLGYCIEVVGKEGQGVALQYKTEPQHMQFISSSAELSRELSSSQLKL